MTQEKRRRMEFGALSEWYLVKLELGPGGEFPQGSPARAFLLRVPLVPGGSIDDAALAASPRGAFVRRFWENEPDRSGAVLLDPAGWNFVFPGEAAGGHYRLGEMPIRPGGLVDLAAPSGGVLPFRVVSVRRA